MDQHLQDSLHLHLHFLLSKTGLAEPEHMLLFAKEIKTLNIPPALVVLSSCDSLPKDK